MDRIHYKIYSDWPILRGKPAMVAPDPYRLKIYILDKLHLDVSVLRSVHSYKYIKSDTTTYHIDIVDKWGHEIPLSYTSKEDWFSVLEIIQEFTKIVG